MTNTSEEKTLCILMAEDNPNNLAVTAEAQAGGRFRNAIYAVSSGVEALDFLYKRGKYENAPKPDLIILDLNLQGIDGRQILAEIKKDEHLKRIPVVVMSMSHNTDDILKAYDSHANCYIPKPTDMDGFINVVQQIDSFWFDIVRLPVR